MKVIFEESYFDTADKVLDYLKNQSADYLFGKDGFVDTIITDRDELKVSLADGKYTIMFMDYFNDYFYDSKPLDIVKSIDYENFDYLDRYFIIEPSGWVRSLNQLNQFFDVDDIINDEFIDDLLGMRWETIFKDEKLLKLLNDMYNAL